MTAKKVYRLSLGAVLLASAYPLFMGAKMLWAYIQDGGIDVANYPKYIIPYTPICVALIACVAMLPPVLKWCERLALPVLSAMGAALFWGVEICFEQVAVFTNLSEKTNIETWQMLSCVSTPLVKATAWDSLNIRYNPLFKIHFYAIALLIVWAVTGVVYGFYKMARSRDFSRKKPLVAQLVSVTAFVGLCIFACFTAFFRTGNIIISPISAALMTVFFLLFGITAGIYAGTWLYGKRKPLSVAVPSAVSMIVTVVMYIGEMVMMGGALYRFGRGFWFDRLRAVPLSFVDVMTILLSGAVTYFLLTAIRAKEGKNT